MSAPPASYVVDGVRCRTSAAFFNEWATALGFPDYFGHNWDAFEECLADLDWLEGNVRIDVRNSERLLADEPDRKQTLFDILETARRAHAETGRKFSVRFDQS